MMIWFLMASERSCSIDLPCFLNGMEHSQARSALMPGAGTQDVSLSLQAKGRWLACMGLDGMWRNGTE